MPNKGQGGVTASKGFEYQDYATLDAFLQNYMTPGFVGVQPENKNDFKVLNEDKNRVISGQVKSDVEAIGKVKEVVHKLPSNEPNYCIYLSHANNDLRRFIDGLNDRRKNNDTGLSIWIKKKIENIEDDDLLKIEKSDFIVVPEPSKEKYIIGTLATCLQNLKIIDINFIDLENSLLRICAKCRSTQGIITKKDFLNAIDKHKKYVDLSVSIDITHNLYGLKADINAVIDTYIDKNDTSVGELRILKADVNSNNSDALIVSARLADNNPKYQILEKGVRLLFEKNTSKKVEYIPKELKNFANVINGIYALQNNNFELALELWQQIADYNEFKVNIKYLKGLTEYFLGNYEDAIKDLKRICDTQGDIHEVQCLCWYIIYLCKLNKYIFYSDFSELEKAHILDPKNKLVIVSLIDKYTFWGNFDEVIETVKYFV